MPLSSRKEVKQFVHKKILFRLRRLAVFFVVVFGILLYNIFQNNINPIIAVGGFVLGYIIGISLKRMHTLSWDAETNKAITRMDKVGIAILVGYLLFSLFRHWIFSHWFHGQALTIVTLAIASGGILGRLYSFRKRIRNLLKQEGFLHPPNK